MTKHVRQLLEQHIAEIVAQLDPARAEVAVLERELADAKKALSAIANPGRVAELIGAAEPIRPRVFYGGGGEAEPTPSPTPAPPPSPYSKLTMKQLVRKALGEHFPNGATANELLEFFADAWGRHDVVRTSLSPQLSRLKREGVIALYGLTWRLTGNDDEHDNYNENGAPPAEPTSAPEAGEAATSPNDDQSVMRLIG